MKVNVFLSYARKEQTFAVSAAEFVQSLTQALQREDPEHEYVVFLDQEGIQSSEDWRSRVLAELRESHIFLFTNSQTWFESQWCVRELKEFAHSGRKSGQSKLPVGRALLPLVSQKVDFGKVPWLRRFNARYVDRLIQTRQRPKNFPDPAGIDSNIDPEAVAQEIIDIKETLPDLSPIYTPSFREFWSFLPIGLKIISAAILFVIIGIAAFLANNYMMHARGVEARQGKFRNVVRNHQAEYSDMRVGINTLLPAGLPSRLLTLQAHEGQTFSRQWGFAVNDVERYFSSMTSCLEKKTCEPVDHAELCALAKKAIDGHSNIYSFFNEDGGGRGFTFAMGGSKPIFEMSRGSTIYEPSLRHTTKFYQLACATPKETGVGSRIKVFSKVIVGGNAIGNIPSDTNTEKCSNDLKYALSWAGNWQSQADLGQIQHLLKLKEALGDMETEIGPIDGVNMILQQFSQAIRELQEVRRRNRPDIDPEKLDEALIERIVRDANNSHTIARPMANCIEAALANNPKSPDDVVLGAALLLDTFFAPETDSWISTIRTILADSSRRDLDALRDLIDAMESNYNSFLEWSKGGNYLNCQQVMEKMFDDPGFRFRLRNRRDPENNMRILSFSQDTVTRSIGKLRTSCTQ